MLSDRNIGVSWRELILRESNFPQSIVEYHCRLYGMYHHTVATNNVDLLLSTETLNSRFLHKKENRSHLRIFTSSFFQKFKHHLSSSYSHQNTGWWRSRKFAIPNKRTKTRIQFCAICNTAITNHISGTSSRRELDTIVHFVWMPAALRVWPISFWQQLGTSY